MLPLALTSYYTLLPVLVRFVIAQAWELQILLMLAGFLLAYSGNAGELLLCGLMHVLRLIDCHSCTAGQLPH